MAREKVPRARLAFALLLRNVIDSIGHDKLVLIQVLLAMDDAIDMLMAWAIDAPSEASLALELIEQFLKLFPELVVSHIVHSPYYEDFSRLDDPVVWGLLVDVLID